MSSRAVKPRRDDGFMGSGWESIPEQAPSPVREGVGRLFPVLGFPALVLGLILTFATSRLETDPFWRKLSVNSLGGLGAAMTLVALLAGLFARSGSGLYASFLPGEGGVLLL